MAFLRSRIVDSSALYVSDTQQLSYGLISDHQSIINGRGRLRVPPFTSDILSLIRCFTLIHVTMDITGTKLYDYYGFVCRPSVHNTRITAVLSA